MLHRMLIHVFMNLSDTLMKCVLNQSFLYFPENSVNSLVTQQWLNIPEVNSQILPQSFQEGEKHEIWDKDAIRGGELKLIWSYAKINNKNISWGFSFSAHMFACKDENVKFSAFRLLI